MKKPVQPPSRDAHSELCMHPTAPEYDPASAAAFGRRRCGALYAPEVCGQQGVGPQVDQPLTDSPAQCHTIRGGGGTAKLVYQHQAARPRPARVRHTHSSQKCQGTVSASAWGAKENRLRNMCSPCVPGWGPLHGTHTAVSPAAAWSLTLSAASSLHGMPWAPESVARTHLLRFCLLL